MTRMLELNHLLSITSATDADVEAVLCISLVIQIAARLSAQHTCTIIFLTMRHVAVARRHDLGACMCEHLCPTAAGKLPHEQRSRPTLANFDPAKIGQTLAALRHAPHVSPRAAPARARGKAAGRWQLCFGRLRVHAGRTWLLWFSFALSSDQSWTTFGPTWPKIGHLSEVGQIWVDSARSRRNLNDVGPSLAEVGHMLPELDQLRPTLANLGRSLANLGRALAEPWPKLGNVDQNNSTELGRSWPTSVNIGPKFGRARPAGTGRRPKTGVGCVCGVS